MSIREISEDWTGRNAQENYNQSPTGKRRFVVVTEETMGEFSMMAAARALTEEALEAIDSVELPEAGDSFPDDEVAELKATAFTCQRSVEDPLTWVIDVQYTVPDNNLTLSYPEQPWKNPIVVAWESNSTEVSFSKDLTGAAVVNSAGDPYEATQELLHRILTVTRNVESHSVTTASSYENSYNLAAKTICGLTILAKCGLIKRWTGVPAYTPKAVKYYVETIIIDVIMPVADGQYQPTWVREILDQGYYYLDGSDKKHFKDADGNDMTQPQLLDGSGGALASGSAPCYKTFKQRKELTWASLDLPEDL